MAVRFPAPLKTGDRIGVTAPSTGVDHAIQPRLDVAIAAVEDHGFEVVVGDCMEGTTVVSAPVIDRAAELQTMLVDPAIRAIVPPWGGQLAVEILPPVGWVDRARQIVAVAGHADFLGQGQLSIAVAVDEHVVRFPRHPLGAEQIRTERGLVPQLRAIDQVNLPTPEHADLTLRSGRRSPSTGLSRARSSHLDCGTRCPTATELS